MELPDQFRWIVAASMVVVVVCAYHLVRYSYPVEVKELEHVARTLPDVLFPSSQSTIHFTFPDAGQNVQSFPLVQTVIVLVHGLFSCPEHMRPLAKMLHDHLPQTHKASVAIVALPYVESWFDSRVGLDDLGDHLADHAAGLHHVYPNAKRMVLGGASLGGRVARRAISSLIKRGWTILAVFSLATPHHGIGGDGQFLPWYHFLFDHFLLSQQLRTQSLSEQHVHNEMYKRIPFLLYAASDDKRVPLWSAHAHRLDNRIDWATNATRHMFYFQPNLVTWFVGGHTCINRDSGVARTIATWLQPYLTH